MTQFEQEQAAKKFVEIWKDKGNEKSEAQKFWIQLLRDVYGIEDSEQYIDFELPVKIKNTSFADGFIADTQVLIEMKSKDVDLTKPEKQSDGSMLTPFEQAKRYADELVYDYGVKWIIVSNFQEIHIYNMRKRREKPEIISLKNLNKDYYMLSFIVNKKEETIKREEEISFEAGKIIGRIYDAIKPLYGDTEEDSHNLNILCVRLVFCLYAEDAHLFGSRLMFYEYLNQYSADNLREALLELFQTLNTKIDERSQYIKESLKEFPYVNGGLFDASIDIPRLDDNIRNILLEEASKGFDWSEISPTIFGGIFESTLNQEIRRNGGMHYTSVDNIRKVIKPLFLDELQYEFESIKKSTKNKRKALYDFQDRISKLTFLDPACGSGNFLTQTYLELREIENNIIRELLTIGGKKGNNVGQILIDGESSDRLIKVSLNQFYGIEINDFAVSVAKTALWIAEHQMFEKTRLLTFTREDFLPLKSYTNIIEGNALGIDWNDIISNKKLNYILGNPPFVGARLMSGKQKNDIERIFEGVKNKGNLDYVSCWYKVASSYMKGTNIEASLVSTNSICQGEQPAILWKELFDNGIKINYAYRTFRWDSEASIKARVHCIIVGFSYISRKEKFIYEENKKTLVDNINGYLVNAPSIFIESRNTSICDVNPMDFGSMPNDSGYLSDYSKEDVKAICKEYPEARKFIKRILGADEFINNKERYCIWLKDVNPSEYRYIPPIMEAINKVQIERRKSKRDATKKLASVPYLFGEIRQPNSDYLLIPSTSSERRSYIPIGFMNKNVISTNANLIIPNATLYEFGILISNVHMAWMRAIAGRLKSDYRYSAKIVYNNFPWPNPTKEQRERIEQTATSILKARELHSNDSLADLYDPKTMPKELINAHAHNDIAVMKAYGFDNKKMSESDCVAELMKMYQELVNKE